MTDILLKKKCEKKYKLCRLLVNIYTSSFNKNSVQVLSMMIQRPYLLTLISRTKDRSLCERTLTLGKARKLIIYTDL